MVVRRHKIGQRGGAGCRFKYGLQHVGPIDVTALNRFDPGAVDLKIPATVVVQAPAEHGRAVASRQAAPIHLAGLGDQGTGVHVADQAAIAYGQVVRLVIHE